MWTIGKLENRIPLSKRSNEGKLTCSVTCLEVFGFGLLREVEVETPPPEVEAVAMAAAAAAEDFEAERDEACFDIPPPALEIEGLRWTGFDPGGNGFFRGGAIVGRQQARLCAG